MVWSNSPWRSRVPTWPARWWPHHYSGSHPACSPRLASCDVWWEKINSGHGACSIIKLYLFTVILTTGSPLKLPPSVLEWRLSRPPTPGTIWSERLNVKKKKATGFVTIGMRPHDCICVLIWQRLLTKSLHSLTKWYGDKLFIGVQHFGQWVF